MSDPASIIIDRPEYPEGVEVFLEESIFHEQTPAGGYWNGKPGYPEEPAWWEVKAIDLDGRPVELTAKEECEAVEELERARIRSEYGILPRNWKTLSPCL